MLELNAKSSSRGGQDVIWVAVHTAEGPYDDDPADPKVDPGSAQDLLAYFQRDSVRASSHAIADDDVLLDNLVSYGRGAWTLRGGNSRSDNLELCGRAGWSRTTWLTHDGMLDNCAEWITRRAAARGWTEPLVRIGAAGVAARRRGVIGHIDYTEGADDGSHWDPGPGFPWDVVLDRANRIKDGREDQDMTPEDWKRLDAKLDDIRGAVGNAVTAATAARGNTGHLLVMVGALAKSGGYDVIRSRDDAAVYVVIGDHRVHVDSVSELNVFGGWDAVEVVEPGDPRMDLPVLTPPAPEPVPTPGS